MVKFGEHKDMIAGVAMVNFAMATAMTPHCGTITYFYANMVYTGLSLIVLHASK